MRGFKDLRMEEEVTSVEVWRCGGVEVEKKMWSSPPKPRRRRHTSAKGFIPSHPGESLPQVLIRDDTYIL
jgi:hypothetical protein